MDQYFKLFGCEVKDVVTGFTGIVTTISFDLYGCVQAIVTSQELNGDKDPDRPSKAFWFDMKRLSVLNSKSVMAVPTFESVPGGSSYPRQASTRA